MDYKEVIDRASNLQEFEVQVTLPEDFKFTGTVPFDMEIYGNQVFVKVLAINIEEAVSRANKFFAGD